MGPTDSPVEMAAVQKKAPNKLAPLARNPTPHKSHVKNAGSSTKTAILATYSTTAMMNWLPKVKSLADMWRFTVTYFCMATWKVQATGMATLHRIAHQAGSAASLIISVGEFGAASFPPETLTKTAHMIKNTIPTRWCCWRGLR